MLFNNHYRASSAMKRTLFALSMISLFLLGCGGGADRDLTGALRSITTEEMQQHMLFLASDSLKGRNTPSPELDTAAAYIARTFQRHGLRPFNGSYFQQFHLDIVSLTEPNGLKILKGDTETSYEIKTDFTPFEMTANRTVSAPLVFAGYGITAPEYHYDDYANVDVRGKIVVVLRHEPREEDSTAVFMGKALTDYANVSRKVRIAREHGAVGLLVITDPLNHTSLTPRGFPWPSLSKTIPSDALPMTMGAEESEKIPVIHVGASVISALFGSVEGLREIQVEIDSTMTPHSFRLMGAEARVQTSTSVKVMPTKNVVGYLEGSDPVLKNQVVVVGAHYDHVGFKKQHGEGEDYIFNGADDNASGTCAIIGVSAGLGALPVKPKRSIVLVAFAGEEKGLFGSEFYTRHPLLPLDSTVAMLNIDMVGRNGRDSLYLVEGSSSPDLDSLAKEENSRIGFVLVDFTLPPGEGSDHMSFQKKNIPSLFFHSGSHADLHQVSDNPDKIDFVKMTRAARLVFLTTVRLANDSHRYRYVAKPISIF
jgi:hypothetical protein